MTPERFKKLEVLVEAIASYPEEEREGQLLAACGDDFQLLREAQGLLASYDQVENFLERQALEPAESPPSDATRIGPYRILRELGRGGMGVVYLAVRKDEIRRRVALKVLPPGLASDHLHRRFKSERQILASLDHPNIAKLFDGGSTEDGRPYLVMELIEGTPIDQYCDQNRLNVDCRIELFLQVCAAVQYAHQNLIIHRDLKPANILVTPEGVPKLLDFGIAKLLNPELFPFTVEATRTQLRPMTPNYASPEQLRGQPITTASDVYSLGVLLYQLVTGRLPHRFTSLHPGAIEQVLSGEEPTRPSTAITQIEGDEASGSLRTPEALALERDTPPAQLRRQLAGDLDNIVLMALRKEPQRRYPSVEQFAEDLRRHQKDLPVRARADTLGYRVGKFLRRNRVPVAAVALLFALVVAFTVTVTLQSRELARERDRAEKERVKAQRISDFMVELFEEVDPSEGRVNEITVREVMDRGVGRIQERLGDQPEVQATLLHTIGSVYTNLFLFHEGEQILVQALEKRKALPGEHGLDIADTLKALYFVYFRQSRMREALAAAEEEFGIRKSLLGADSPELLYIMIGQVNILSFLGEFSEAQVLISRIDAIIQDSDRLLENEKAVLTGSQAMLDSLSGNHERAEKFYTSYLQSAPARPNTAAIKFNLAALYRSTGHFQAAEELLLDFLIDAENFHGSSSTPYLRGLLSLTWTYIMQGSLDEARSALERAEKILELSPQRVSGDLGGRFDLARFYFYSGIILDQQGEQQDSDDLFRKTVEITSSLITEAGTVWSRDLHSKALLLLGEIGEARPVAEDLLRIGWKNESYEEFCASYGIFPPHGNATVREAREATAVPLNTGTRP